MTHENICTNISKIEECHHTQSQSHKEFVHCTHRQRKWMGRYFCRFVNISTQNLPAIYTHSHSKRTYMTYQMFIEIKVMCVCVCVRTFSQHKRRKAKQSNSNKKEPNIFWDFDRIHKHIKGMFCLSFCVRNQLNGSATEKSIGHSNKSYLQCLSIVAHTHTAPWENGLASNGFWSSCLLITIDKRPFSFIFQ